MQLTLVICRRYNDEGKDAALAGRMHRPARMASASRIANERFTGCFMVSSSFFILLVVIFRAYVSAEDSGQAADAVFPYGRRPEFVLCPGNPCAFQNLQMLSVFNYNYTATSFQKSTQLIYFYSNLLQFYARQICCTFCSALKMSRFCQTAKAGRYIIYNYNYQRPTRERAMVYKISRSKR